MIEKTDTITSKKVDFLRTKIQKQIDGFERRRVENRNRAIQLNIVSVVGGITVTVLLGLKLAGVESFFSTVALIISGLVTLANALEGIFGYSRLWLQYTSTTNELRGLRDDIEYLLLNGMENVTVEQIDDLYARYSALLRNTNIAWGKVREEQVHQSART